MTYGLIIDESAFKLLGSRDRDTLIYKNLVHHHNRMDIIENAVDNLSRSKLIGSIWLFVLSVAMGFRRYIPIF